ncbi:PREDICTED: KIF1-binding protein-like [Dinoponera quadriceps]|uniref:KIF-binding protein n=1 Tax=Dinoponera quadriceps TaxID=609295 RepID=A0A6P3X9Y7_DINQU|nr:PREDICTED: KIF1-binding protein-like [Dinoponera quadriceps]
MSSESTNDQRCKSVDLDNEIQLLQRVGRSGSTESSDRIMVDISGELVDFLSQVAKTVMDKSKNKFPQEPDEVVRTIEANMNKFSQRLKNSQNVKPDDSICLAEVYLQMSTIYHNSNFKKEKLFIGEAYLRQCVMLLRDKELDPKAILTVTLAYLELGHLWDKLNNLNNSRIFTNKVLQLYKSYTQDNNPVPVRILTTIGISVGEHSITLEKLYWHALRNLTLLSCKNIISEVEQQNIVRRMHKLLAKQLERTPSVERIEWTKDAIYLAKLFLTYDRFAEAKNHIAAAAFMMKQYFNEGRTTVDDTETLPEKEVVLNEQYNFGMNRVNICWAWYGVTLLNASMKQLLDDNMEDGPSGKASDSQFRKDSVIQLTRLLFTNLEKELQEFTAFNIDTYIKNYRDARQVFQHVLDILYEVKLYVMRYNNLELYTEFVKCTSKVHKYFACYEQDKSNRIEIYEKRVLALSNIMRSLRPEDHEYLFGYTSLELSAATSALLDIKLENLPIEDVVNSLEIKDLVRSSVRGFQLYLNHFPM